jgi:hypothetical protein
LIINLPEETAGGLLQEKELLVKWRANSGRAGGRMYALFIRNVLQGETLADLFLVNSSLYFSVTRQVGMKCHQKQHEPFKEKM